MRIEAIFGAALAAFVVAIAIYAIANNQPGVQPPTSSGPVASFGDVETPDDTDACCQCFWDAYELAGSDVGVMSAQYRQGFQHCRAQLGRPGGNAWTAGWNARLSSQPELANCSLYLKTAKPACHGRPAAD